MRIRIRHRLADTPGTIPPPERGHGAVYDVDDSLGAYLVDLEIATREPVNPLAVVVPMKAPDSRASAEAGEGDIPPVASGAALGSFLRAVRERRHMTLEQISERTKIGTRHLEALESGHVEYWPKGIYRRAMIRGYADSIGLNGDAAVRAFVDIFERNETPVNDLSMLAMDPGHRAERRLTVGLIPTFAVGTLAFVLAMGGLTWKVLSNPGRDMAGREAEPGADGAVARVDATQSGSPSFGAVGSSGSHRVPATRDGGSTGSMTVDSALPPESDPGPASMEGELRIASNPVGARVTVNGVGWGVTPLAIRYLPLGQKQLRIAKDGYVSTERRLLLSSDRPVRALTVNLRER